MGGDRYVGTVGASVKMNGYQPLPPPSQSDCMMEQKSSVPITVVAKAKVAPLWAAAKACGGQSALGRTLGVHPTEIGQWVNCKKVPPHKWFTDDVYTKKFLDVIGCLPGDIWPDDLTDDMLNYLSRPVEHTASVCISQLASLNLISRDRIEVPDAQLIRREQGEQVDDMLGTLTAREARVISRRFGLNGNEVVSLQQIGSDEGGLSKERMRQIESKGLSKLRANGGKVCRALADLVEYSCDSRR